MDNVLLNVKDLEICFHTYNGIVKAVRGMNFALKRGETLGMVGESGCGKSATALSILQLIPNPPGEIINGEIWFKADDLLKMKSKNLRRIRGNNISMIFQEPMTSLNPVYTIGHQIAETIVLHRKLNKDKAIEETIKLLDIVSIPFPERRIHEYPHQLSGGMKQRAMIAMALSCNPELLIADEPTTALDVTIQAQILDLIKRMKKKYGMSVLMITHDLGVIAEVSENVIVVYAGEVIEYSDVKSLFLKPKHPYTMALLKAIPKLTDTPRKKLEVIKGNIADPISLPTGCKFHPRCEYVINFCKKKEPKLEKIGDNHFVSCWIYDKEKAESFKSVKEKEAV